jgi:hypothetical protein
MGRPGSGHGESISERCDGRERSRVEQTDDQEHPESRGRQQAKSNERGKSCTESEQGAKRLGEVGEPPYKGPRNQPDRRAGREQKPKLVWHKPSRFEERRQKWRRDPERGVHQGVESDETAQWAHRLISRRDVPFVAARSIQLLTVRGLRVLPVSAFDMDAGIRVGSVGLLAGSAETRFLEAGLVDACIERVRVPQASL